MPNPTTGFGFQAVRRIDGAAVTFQTNVRQIDPTYNTAIGRGDVVVSDTSGYIERADPGDGRVSGIFAGCEFFDTVRQQWQFLPNWPGAQSAANNLVRAFVMDDTKVVFRVRSSGANIGLSAIGANIDLATVTAPNISGYSTERVDPATINTTATLPFRIVGLGDGDVSNDPAAANNIIDVVLNAADYNELLGV